MIHTIYRRSKPQRPKQVPRHRISGLHDHYRRCRYDHVLVVQLSRIEAGVITQYTETAREGGREKLLKSFPPIPKIISRRTAKSASFSVSTSFFHFSPPSVQRISFPLLGFDCILGIFSEKSISIYVPS